jgi:hypothetical protein
MTKIAYPNDPSMQRLLHEYLRDAPEAVFRFFVHKEFQVPLWEGVDEKLELVRENFLAPFRRRR